MKGRNKIHSLQTNKIIVTVYTLETTLQSIGSSRIGLEETKKLLSTSAMWNRTPPVLRSPVGLFTENEKLSQYQQQNTQVYRQNTKN